MEMGNILVIGNSGVGKSTLINAVLGEEKAETGWGAEGTTKELRIYTNSEIPFRLIDTVGFEPSLFKERAAINAVRKWSREATKDGNENRAISVIWFCVDGTSRKLFSKTIKDLSKATSMWKSVPVVAVITKSYSVPEREQNIDMVKAAFAAQKPRSKNLRKVVPVVASPYVLNDTAFAPPEGITELIEITNDLIPEGIKAGAKDIVKIKLDRKRALAQGVIGVATSAGVVVGAVPFSFSDALLLGPTEVAEINALARIYGLAKNDESNRFFNSIIEAGTVGVGAKTVISALKAIPGINVGASVLNAITAGVIIAALGESSVAMFEKVYLGEKSISDIDWVKKVMESNLSNGLVNKIQAAVERITADADKDTIVRVISDLFFKK